MILSPIRVHSCPFVVLFLSQNSHGVMYYFAKFLQFAGLTLVAIGFWIRFPALMDPKLFIAGIVFCAAGWAIQRYLLV